MINNRWGEFCRVFGVTPRNRVLEFFLACRELDFTIGNVIKETGLGRATAYDTTEELIREKYVIPTRKVAGGQLYKLDLKKKEVKVLIRALNMVLRGIAEEYSKKEEAVAYSRQLKNKE